MTATDAQVRIIMHERQKGPTQEQATVNSVFYSTRRASLSSSAAMAARMMAPWRIAKSAYSANRVTSCSCCIASDGNET